MENWLLVYRARSRLYKNLMDPNMRVKLLRETVPSASNLRLNSTMLNIDLNFSKYKYILKCYRTYFLKFLAICQNIIINFHKCDNYNNQLRIIDVSVRDRMTNDAAREDVRLNNNSLTRLSNYESVESHRE